MKNDQEKWPIQNENQESKYDIELSYLTNADNTDKISQIVFPDYPDVRVDYPALGIIDEWDNTQVRMNEKHFDIYHLKEVRFRIYDVSEDVDDKDKVLEQATIYFTDGSEINVDLGEIHLKTSEPRKEPLEMYSTILFEGILENRFEVREKVTLTDARIDQIDEYRDLVDIQIDGVPISEAEGMTFLPDSTVVVTSTLKSDEDRMTEFTQIDLAFDIILTDEEGKEIPQKISSVISEGHVYNFWDVHDYVKIREAE
ncbi:hypothetical protein VXN63_06165 [Marinilactibacillus sp. XAAS-LB27]|uniref:hypothetical protein n=1 Tax=Marinilactibacillus sp. XAAS-LB27 TaxID=3114538 RepID=UPI002E18ABFC|nr:hypothetical protein [Marinilactibacillus sp. XAAS-LB27]